MMFSEEPFAALNQEIGRLTVLAVDDTLVPADLRHMASCPHRVKSIFRRFRRLRKTVSVAPLMMLLCESPNDSSSAFSDFLN
jgi:hypothetical protein